jgi:polyisoprenyl-phosphate glycosyltransferase
MKSGKLISVVIPCFNEGLNVAPFFDSLKNVIAKDKQHSYEVIYVNDGSRDNTLSEIQDIYKANQDIKVVALSRNFGKEIATSAGIEYSTGNAIILIDGDGQHPAELLPTFIKKWEDGAQVVTGVRKSNRKEGFVKKYGSKVFYRLFNKYAGVRLVPGSTDYRLIDESVRDEFIKLTERNRITRGLIDWLGFRQDFVYFKANERMAGKASYSINKLVTLALNSFVSLSLKPLYFSVYTGFIVLLMSLLLIIFSVGEMVVGDPLNLRITGSAYLVMLILFLIGIILISLGIIALYLSHIHTETQNRPLFVVDKKSSHGISASKAA